MSENYRNELALLDLKDAFKLAFQRSGKTQTTVARKWAGRCTTSSMFLA